MDVVPTYFQQDSSPEVAETKQSAFRYIMEGDTLDCIYDPKGILVFAIIAALRENDDSLYGENANLNNEQLERLAEVEAELDRAVERDMHYYPFGEKDGKRQLGAANKRAIAGTHEKPLHEATRVLKNQVRHSLLKTKLSDAAAQALGKPEDRNGPVVKRKSE